MFVLVAGHFNVLHPGHIRLFKFARGLGTRLTVAVESDRLAGQAAHIHQELRLEAVASCSLVDEAFVFDEPVTQLIARLKPPVVVKGREHEGRFNPEAATIAAYGGSLLFSSGEMQFSSADLIHKGFISQIDHAFTLPSAFMQRHGISATRLSELIERFSTLRSLTVGDLIVDDYITCEALGMSQEDPTLVVTPIDTKRFIGGAGIVAAHARGLGAESTLISVTGDDAAKQFCLSEFERLDVGSVLVDDLTRPTTVKQRYRSHNKTLLRVSHLQQSAISVGLQVAMINGVKQKITNCDLLIFSDFNYGALPQTVVDEVTSLAQKHNVLIAADSQSSSQIGDVGRFKMMDLLLPTEREARVSTQNREDGLVVLAEQLRRKSSAKSILLKLGGDGVLIHAPGFEAEGWLTDQVEALNKSPKDVAGAGDSMLITSALTLAAGGTIWEAACIGSIAAAVQVGRVGNIPLGVDELRRLF